MTISTLPRPLPAEVFKGAPPAPPPPEEAEHPVAQALRKELQRLLEQPLTVSRAIKLARTVSAAVKVLKVTTEGVDGLLPGVRRRRPLFMGLPQGEDWQEYDEQPVDGVGIQAVPYGPLPGGETFGNQAIREFIGGIRAMIEAKNAPKLEDMVAALKTAKDAGEDEVVEALRAQIRDRLQKEEEVPEEPTAQQELFAPAAPGLPQVVAAAAAGQVGYAMAMNGGAA
jgi:hypothetical protein